MNEHAGQIAAMAAALGWTISAVCWTSAGKRVGSLVVNTVRLVIALALFVVYGWLIKGEPIPLGASQHAWLWLSISGAMGYFLCDLFLFRSLLLIGPRLALLILSLAPLVASLCGWWWLNERLSSRDILGMIIALSGVIFVVFESPRRKRPPGTHVHFSWLGILFAFLALLNQGASVVLAKIGMRDFESPIAATEIRVIAGLICFAILMPILGRHKQCLAVFKDRRTISIIAVGSLAGPTIGVALLMYALTQIPSGLAMTFISLTPIMIIPFSVLLFKEHVSVRAILGAVVACAGLMIMSR
jgi:drug/metabolite transporter (DMT)-like permease